MIQKFAQKTNGKKIVFFGISLAFLAFGTWSAAAADILPVASDGLGADVIAGTPVDEIISAWTGRLVDHPKFGSYSAGLRRQDIREFDST